VPGNLARPVRSGVADFGFAPTIHPFAPATDDRPMSASMSCGDVNDPGISPLPDRLRQHAIVS
jgi:hypothetical protein